MDDEQLAAIILEKKKSIHTFNIGRVFQNGIVTITNNMVPLVFFSILLNIPPLLLEFLTIGPDAGGNATLGVGIALFALEMIGLTVYMAMNAVLIGVVSAQISDKESGVSNWFASGFNALLQHGPALFIIGLVSWLIIVASAFIFLIPAIYLSILWAVICPVLVIENAGYVRSFSRSAQLSLGYRWWILLFLILTSLAMYGSILATYFLGVSIGWSTAGYDYLNFSEPGSIPFYLFQNAFEFVITGITAVFSVYLYEELKFLQDGEDVSSIGAVFD
jgi:hypothetical protein